jgi:suppressor for copper-sensitivity B
VAGHLASGLFATLMATPCSAPFLGTALAFALGQSAGTIFAMFTAVGLGMALPYLALAAFPGAARLLPRPGPWMDTLRKVMGFLLAGAAVWLLYVLGSQVSLERRAWIELALLGTALLVWLRHRAVAGPLVRRSAGVGVAALVLVTLAVGWRADEARALSGEGSGGAAVAGLIEWEEFDRSRAEALASEGRLVFVDVTADWCFTCKVNERLVLETRPVAEAFGRFDVVPMKADWTNRDDTIAAFLEDHGRYGIPFYLLYRPGAEPHVFSELLTQDRVIGVLEAAAADDSVQAGL